MWTNTRFGNDKPITTICVEYFFTLYVVLVIMSHYMCLNVSLAYAYCMLGIPGVPNYWVRNIFQCRYMPTTIHMMTKYGIR